MNNLPNRAGKGCLLVLTLVWFTLLTPTPYVHADPDLPGASANTELIPAGSLVIPMDNDKQNIGAAFNLKAYGLVNKLLWDEIPVKWAIRAGKGKDGIDFTVEAKRIFPSALTAATLTFRAGPFIVHRNWAGYARSKISAFGNNVAVYELTQDVTVDIRHNLTQKRRVGALDDGGNAGIHVGVLSDAGFVAGTHYETIDIATLVTLNATKCITTATEPHFDADSADIDTQAQAVRTFVEAGGNFLAQCVATTTYENNGPYGLYQTDNGIVENNQGNALYDYLAPDLPYSQFQGNLADTGGSVNDFELLSGSSFRNSGHVHVRNTPLPDVFVATLSKLTGGVGSLVFYLGGHEYGNGNLEDINGQRMYMNAVMTPAVRPGTCGFDFVDDPSVLRNIAGTVKEDVNGDSNMGDAVPAANVRVRIYADVNGNGIVDAGDTFIEETATDGSGAYTFQVSTGANGTKYLVTADSKTIPPNAGIKVGFTQGDVWAEQTYGDNPATSVLDVGSRFGGRTPGVSDAVSAASTDPAANVYQHVARIDVTSGNVSGADFGFSFNVVTNVRGGDNADDDGSANRTVQGNLRQFIQNANAITGANAMRFVPAVATNASGGGGSWWRIPVTVLLPAIMDASTTVDGRAYDFSNGTTVRDTNPGTLGSGGTVGAGALSLSTVSRPELEIVASGGRAIGLDLQAGSAAVRNLAISGFGTGSNNDGHGNIRAGAFSGAAIDNNVIGSGAGSFTDPGLGAKGDGIRVVSGATGGVVRNNLIGFAGGSGIGMKGAGAGWLLEGNEIRGNGLNDANLAGVYLEESSAAVTVRGNLIAANRGAGLDQVKGTAAHVLENNTATGNGTGGSVTAGVRLKETVGGRIDRNVIFGNTGAGVMVNQNAAGNTITRNSIYGNSSIGIDLVVNNSNTGDGVTLNDSGDGDSGGNGLLNYPILGTATIIGSDLELTGFARPGSVIELFIADVDPTGFGEGKTYLATLTEGSAADMDAGTGTYGPGQVNNILQGTDTTSRFRFVIPLPAGVSLGTWLTATATVAGSTSEFSAKSAVGPFSITGTVYEDVNGDGSLSGDAGRPGVTLYLFRDGGDDLPTGADDVYVISTTTNGSGQYTFTALGQETYWVVANSKTVPPTAGIKAGFTQANVWAQQTYGIAGALCANGSGGTTERATAGVCYGGRQGSVSDPVFPVTPTPATLAVAQHVIRQELSTTATGVDFGFSFNVVTNVRGGDNADDDGSAARTIQGSLRQFIQNANAITGANAMRFVPAVATNGSGGGGSWWRLSVSEDLPDVLDASTTIDGRAYSLSDGTTVRDDNPGVLGTGGTVGVGALSLPTVFRPELEVADANNRNVGLNLLANTTTIRRLAIFGFGDSRNNDGEANLRVGAVSGTLVEECVVGASAGSFTDPLAGNTADNIRVIQGATNGTVRNNLIGFSDGNGIGMKKAGSGWLVEGNEIRGNAKVDTSTAGVFLEENSAAVTVRGNLIAGNRGAGVDQVKGTAAHILENNTLTGNGTGGTVTAGVRLKESGGARVDRNVIFSNTGAGVMINQNALTNKITKNSIYGNSAIGIDLVANNSNTGDGVTINDPGDVDSGGNGRLNFPIISSATVIGSKLVLIGFARPGSEIELFLAQWDYTGFGQGKTYVGTVTEGSGADLDAGTGTYGPGPINNFVQGSDTTNRFHFEIDVPGGVVPGLWLTATATLGGSTSEFSGRVIIGPSYVSGKVYEDVNGDASLSDGQPLAGVTVKVYQDGGDGLPDGADDIYGGSVTTDASGIYSALVPTMPVWVLVDSRTIPPSAGFSGGNQNDVWAEQTYGTPGALCTNGSGGTGVRSSAGPCFGGRRGNVSDDPSTLASAEHVIGVDLTGGDVSGVDFGFSFRVVTNVRGGDTADDDASADRTVQGSLRQFLQNANAISGANAMRFVPAVATNASGGGGSWWRVSVSDDLPDVKNPSTTIDGTAYSLSNGTTVRDDNPGTLGTGGTVGVDSLALPTVSRPELEIVDINNRKIGLNLRAAGATVRKLAIYGFGDSRNNNGEANLRLDSVTGTLVEECVVGASAGSFTNPAAGSTADNIRMIKGGSATVRNNLIGFSDGNGIGLNGVVSGILIEGNEIRGNGINDANLAGVYLDNTAGVATGVVTFRRNRVWENRGAGVDVFASTTAHTLENNTLTGNGGGGTVTAGVRLMGTVGARIDRNVIFSNTGAGVMVNQIAASNTITRNSIYGNSSIGIDLVVNNSNTGDGVTLNDSGDVDSGGNGLLNYPILGTATITGGNLVLTGFARPGSVIELFIADPDPTGFGEGRTYLVTLTEGSGADLDATTGSYTNPVNGLNQGADTTNRFRFDITPLPAGAGIGARLTATATLSGATSEFSGMVTISGTALQQVDSLIKLASEAAGGYLTDNLYEPVATLQSKSQGVVSGSTASYNVMFQNDGNIADNLVITGTGSGSGFTVQYLDNTATDRTADVTGAGYTITDLAPGLNKVWTLNITPSGNPTTVPGGTSYEVFVTATSAADGAKTDQVKAVSSSTSANLTLLKSADKGTAAPGEDITYTINASNGSGLTAAGNVVVTDPIPANTGFKVGGATFNAGDSTLSFTVVYSNDNGSTWAYPPVSGGCGAPAGYDDCVTDVRWTTSGSMPTDTNFSVWLVVRVK